MNDSFPSSAFYSVAGSSLVDYIGAFQCDLVAPDEISTTPVDTKTRAHSPATPSTVALTNTSTPGPGTATPSPFMSGSDSSKTSLKVGVKIAIGFGSVVVVGILAFIICGILRHRKRKLETRKKGLGTPSDVNQPYFQQKGELEAEEKRKYELHTDERRYELAEDTQIHEMSTTDSSYELSTQRTQELKGEEHLRELCC